MLRNLVIFTIFLFSSVILNAQQGYFQIDSLKKELISTPDSEKSVIYNQIIWKLRNSDPAEAIEYGKIALKNAETYNQYEQLAKAYSFLGVAYRNKGDFKQALEYYRFGLEVAETHNLKEQLGYAHINIGNWHLYSEASQPALTHINQALAIAKEIENDRMVAYCELNLGRVYLIDKKLDKAEEIIEKALNFRTETGDISGQAVCYKYLADVYHEKGDNKKALEQYTTSLNIIDKQFDKDLLADLHNKMADIYLETGQMDKAYKSAQSALEISLQTRNPVRIRHAYETHVNIFRKRGQLKQALEYFEYVKNYNDSFYSNQLDEKVSNIRYEVDRDKQKARTDSLRKEKSISDLSLKEERTRNMALGMVLVFSILVLLALHLINRQRKKTNRILEHQKNEIEDINAHLNSKNEEILAQRDEIEAQRDAIERQQVKITDSIIYAQRIQQAALPPDTALEEILPYHFILFMPRDIVSGDFYWMRKIEKNIIVTVADSTGHGVPGAFVSMLGMSILNEIILTHHITEPALILDEMRSRIKTQLRQSADKDSQDDGMDMALCVIDTETLQMRFAAANNTAYLIQKDELIVLKPTLNPVGIYFRELPFEQETVQLYKGDSIYLFSDGYADQFGGKKGRRFMSQRMRQLILKIQKHPFSVQKNILRQKINEWRGHYRQVDDITIMGFKIDDL